MWALPCPLWARGHVTSGLPQPPLSVSPTCRAQKECPRQPVPVALVGWVSPCLQEVLASQHKAKAGDLAGRRLLSAGLGGTVPG